MTPEHLRDSLREQLSAGKRLLVAINRGQLERLESELGDGEADAELRAVVSAVEAGLRLRVGWSQDDVAALGDVLTVDLSLQDNLDERVFGVLLDKACAASPPAAAAAAAGFHEATSLLMRPEVRRRVFAVGAAIQAEGHRATMRQLWALVSHLLTGGRADREEGVRPLSWTDHPGARLFRQPDGPNRLLLVDLAASSADPSRVAHPRLTLALLEEIVQAPGALAGEGGPLAEGVRGVDVVRALWLEGDARLEPQAGAQATLFSKLVAAASRPGGGWTRPAAPIKAVLKILAAVAGQAQVDNGVLPAWRTLAYEDRRRAAVPLVASSNIDVSALRLGRPRPAPAALEVLGGEGGYFVPYLWLSDSTDPASGVRIRLTPTLLRDGAAAQSSRRRSTGAEVMAVRSWLSRAQALPRDEEEVLVLSRAGQTGEGVGVIVRVKDDAWSGQPGPRGGTLDIQSEVLREGGAL